MLNIQRPDPEWQTRIAVIQERIVAQNDPGGEIYNGFKVVRKGLKSGSRVIPEVHTYHANESSVTLEGIDSVEDFVERLDQIEPPGQMISFLTDPLLQKYVELKPSPMISARTDIWLATHLEEQYEAERLGSGSEEELGVVLIGLYKHAQYTKTLQPTALAFLEEYLRIWSGQDHVDAVLGLLSYLTIDTWEEAYGAYLLPLERALVSQDPSSYATLIDFYTTLLHRQTVAIEPQPGKDAIPESSVFHKIAAHVAFICTSLVLSQPQAAGEPLTSSIISFYEFLSSCSKPHAIPIILPPMHLVYLMAQSTSATTLSRICGVIGAYKLAFDQHPKPVKNYYPAAVTDKLNLCLRDMYNLFWVARALNVVEQKSVGLYSDPALRGELNTYLVGLDREYAIGAAFGLSCNVYLASFSGSAWRALEERVIERESFDRDAVRYHSGPVGQRSLDVLKKNGGVDVEWDGVRGYKVFVLNWMAERGLGGMRQFMLATVTDLRGKV